MELASHVDPPRHPGKSIYDGQFAGFPTVVSLIFDLEISFPFL
jgi:hypothetical protein